jgi:L-aspartate oxidase
MGHVITDVLIIGGGAAGLRAAIEASRHARVVLLTKSELTHSSSYWAQGGVAAVWSPADDVEQHIGDTLRVGSGLNRPEAVRRIVESGPDCVGELMDWDIGFDRSEGNPSLTLEGGHSHPRVLHARGDSTGAALVDCLARKVREINRIRVFTDCFFVDVITVEGRCRGAVTHHEKYGHQLIWAGQTILATGGYGQNYRETTTPPVTTGDGVAAAFRAGARVADMEMMQFHPTTLYVAGAGRALISEAVRGEGAYLVDHEGERFMPAFHPDAELAPRDIVSRAMTTRMSESRKSHVFLDVRHIPKERFVARFPTIAKLCADFEIDVSRDLIPVRPSAHYSIGGVVVDLDGSTSLPGLYACGEVSCSGVHGANRLASNSLLECLVFGKSAGDRAGMAAAESEPVVPCHLTYEPPSSSRHELDLVDVKNSLRNAMRRLVGIERDAGGLSEAVESFENWGHYVMDKTFEESVGWETQNMLTTGRLVSRAALERNESRGVHFRRDFDKAGENVYHIVLQRTDGGHSTRRVDTDFRDH